MILVVIGVLMITFLILSFILLIVANRETNVQKKKILQVIGFSSIGLSLAILIGLAIYFSSFAEGKHTTGKSLSKKTKERSSIQAQQKRRHTDGKIPKKRPTSSKQRKSQGDQVSSVQQLEKLRRTLSVLKRIATETRQREQRRARENTLLQSPTQSTEDIQQRLRRALENVPPIQPTRRRSLFPPAA